MMELIRAGDAVDQTSVGGTGRSALIQQSCSHQLRCASAVPPGWCTNFDAVQRKFNALAAVSELFEANPQNANQNDIHGNTPTVSARSFTEFLLRLCKSTALSPCAQTRLNPPSDTHTNIWAESPNASRSSGGKRLVFSGMFALQGRTELQLNMLMDI